MNKNILDHEIRAQTVNIGLDGSSKHFSMNSHKITNLETGEDVRDAVNLETVFLNLFKTRTIFGPV